MYTIKSKNYQIEFFRFIAALLVMGVHLPSIKMGHIGVDIFFIISGFVMMLSTQNNHDHFFLKRLIRIAPLYWLLTLGLFFVALYFPNMLGNTKASIPDLIKSLLFIPFDKNGEGHSPLLFLGWTLNYEMFFYLLFAISLKINATYRGIITSCLICSLFFILQNQTQLPLLAYHDPILLEFILGMMLYELLYNERYNRPNQKVARQVENSFFRVPKRSVHEVHEYRHTGKSKFADSIVEFLGRSSHVLLYMACFFIPAFLTNIHDIRPYLMGGASFLILFTSLKFFSKFPIHRVFIWGGQISYSFYLIHPYIIGILEKKFDLFSENLVNNIPVILFSFLLTFACASALFRYFEKPAMDKLRFVFFKK